MNQGGGTVMDLSLLLGAGVGVMLLGMGLMHLFARNLMWKRTEQFNRARGVAHSERTSEWERSTTWFGVFFVFIGVALLLTTGRCMKSLREPQTTAPGPPSMYEMIMQGKKKPDERNVDKQQLK